MAGFQSQDDLINEVTVNGKFHFNARIGGFFRQSLTEELVTYLGPSNPGE